MTPTEALDRIAAHCDDREHGPGPGWVAVDEVRAILAEVTPESGGALDLRRALVTLLLDYLRGTHVQAVPLADRVLALVRPVAGVTLTPEEAALAAEAALWHASTLDRMASEKDAKRLRALAARLEAAQ